MPEHIQYATTTNCKYLYGDKAENFEPDINVELKEDGKQIYIRLNDIMLFVSLDVKTAVKLSNALVEVVTGLKVSEEV